MGAMHESQNSIAIRDATPDDVEFIVECNLRLARESEGKTLDRSTLEKGVRLGLASPELARYFIATVDGARAGTTMLTFELTDWRCGIIWWLQSVYVLPGARRCGVFRAMYAHVAGLARNTANVRGIRLYVLEGNERARRTYESLGMANSGYLVYEDDHTA